MCPSDKFSLCDAEALIRSHTTCFVVGLPLKFELMPRLSSYKKAFMYITV